MAISKTLLGVARSRPYPSSQASAADIEDGSARCGARLLRWTTSERLRVFAEVARVLRSGGRLALSDIVTERPIVVRITGRVGLWAASIAGACPRGDYLVDIAAAGLQGRVIRRNPQYRFTSERAQRIADRYGAHSISLLALKLRTDEAVAAG